MLECRTELNVIQVPSKRWLVLLSIPKTSACDYFFCIIPTDKLKAFGQLHLLMQSETVNRLCIHTETVMLQGCGASQGKDLGKTRHRNRAASAPFMGFLASFIKHSYQIAAILMLSLYMLLLFCLRAPPTSSACGDHWQGFLPPCWRRCPRTEVGWDEAGMHAWHAWHIATNPLLPPVCLEEAQADPRALVASDK